MTPTPAEPSPDGPRERLIAAGLVIFGRHGYDGATTRMLAERAQVNLAAIPYYFGGKEQLYIAVAEHIVARLRRQMSPVLEAARHTAEDGTASPAALRAALLALLDRLAEFLLAPETDDDVGRFVLHEQLAPTRAFAVLFEDGMKPVHLAVAGLLSRFAHARPDTREMRLRAHMLIGQAVVFRAARAVVLRMLGHEAYTEADRADIRRLIADHTGRLVDSLASPEARR